MSTKSSHILKQTCKSYMIKNVNTKSMIIGNSAMKKRKLRIIIIIIIIIMVIIQGR